MFAEFQRRLSTLDRSVLKMKMEGYRQKEIARRLGYSQGYIAKRIKGIQAKGRLWMLNSLDRG